MRDELIRRIRTDHDTNVKELKMLSAIIRIPKLCQDYQVALRKRYKAKTIKFIKKDAISFMVDQ